MNVQACRVDTTKLSTCGIQGIAARNSCLRYDQSRSSRARTVSVTGTAGSWLEGNFGLIAIATAALK